MELPSTRHRYLLRCRGLRGAAVLVHRRWCRLRWRPPGLRGVAANAAIGIKNEHRQAVKQWGEKKACGRREAWGIPTKMGEIVQSERESDMAD